MNNIDSNVLNKIDTPKTFERLDVWEPRIIFQDDRMLPDLMNKAIL